METPRILIVQTSSMSEVVQAMPVVADIRARFPEAAIDCMVESAFAAIPQMNAGVRRVLPTSWRKWRGQLLSRAAWHAMKSLRAQLRQEPYDVVFDLQGMLQSALWARQARGPVVGYDHKSAQEPVAARLYWRAAAVPHEWEASKRGRALAAAHLGYELPQSAPSFNLVPPAFSPSFKPRDDYAVLIPSSGLASKLWPERHWVAVGRRMLELGWKPLVLWGKPEEQTLAERIAAGCEGDVPPFLKVGEMAAVLAHAQQVVGLDTGFTYLAAALGRPSVVIHGGPLPPGHVSPHAASGQPLIHVGGASSAGPGRNEVLSLLGRRARP